MYQKLISWPTGSAMDPIYILDSSPFYQVLARSLLDKAVAKACMHILHLTLVLLNKLRCHTLFKFSQSDYLIQIVDVNSHTEWQTVQIQISWLLQKSTDLDLHCLIR